MTGIRCSKQNCVVEIGLFITTGFGEEVGEITVPKVVIADRCRGERVVLRDLSINCLHA